MKRYLQSDRPSAVDFGQGDRCGETLKLSRTFTMTDGVFMEPKEVAQVFLLAENRLLREALVRILTTRSNVRVVGAAAYSSAATEKLTMAHPDIVLLDSVGLVFSEASLVSRLNTAIPGVRIVLVDMESDQNTFLRAVREGVVGYVLKDASAMEVVSAIHAVSAGEAVCPPSLSMALFQYVSQHCRQLKESPRSLSRRERELVTLLRERLTNKEIAARLNLSEQTVKNHVHRILRKVGASDRLAIVEWGDRDTPGGVMPKSNWAS
jgi:DNA-binding NarL/FixJ family response regulator